MMMLLLRKAPAPAEGLPEPAKATEKASGRREGVRSFAECLASRPNPLRRRSADEESPVQEKGTKKDDVRRSGGMAASEAKIPEKPVEDVRTKEETLSAVLSKAVKERLVEGIVRVLVDRGLADPRTSGEEDRQTLRMVKGDVASLVEDLKSWLRGFGTEELSGLLSRMKGSDRPWEVLKSWMGGKGPEGRRDLADFGKTVAEFPQAKPMEGKGVFEVTEDGRVLMDKTKVRVVDRRDRSESGGLGQGRSEAAVGRVSDRPPASGLPGSASERKGAAEGKGPDGPFWRPSESRPQAAEVRPQMTEAGRVNRMFAELAQHAKVMLEDKRSVLEVELRPPHLGKVTVKLEVEGERVTARLMAQSEGTGEMLRQNMGDLYQAFREAGFDMSRLDVQVGSDGGARRDGREEATDRTGFGGGTEVGDAEPPAEAFVFTADAWAETARVDALV